MRKLKTTTTIKTLFLRVGKMVPLLMLIESLLTATIQSIFPTALSLQVKEEMARSTVMVFRSGQMAHVMKVCGKMTKLTETVL